MTNATIASLTAQSLILFSLTPKKKEIEKKDCSPIKKYLLEQNKKR